jgi:hypothetical protein
MAATATAHRNFIPFPSFHRRSLEPHRVQRSTDCGDGPQATEPSERSDLGVGEGPRRGESDDTVPGGVDRAARAASSRRDGQPVGVGSGPTGGGEGGGCDQYPAHPAALFRLLNWLTNIRNTRLRRPFPPHAAKTERRMRMAKGHQAHKVEQGIPRAPYSCTKTRSN